MQEGAAGVAVTVPVSTSSAAQGISLAYCSLKSSILKALDQARSACMLLKSSILTAKRLIVTLRVTMVFYHAKCVKGFGTEMLTLPLTQLGLPVRRKMEERE